MPFTLPPLPYSYDALEPYIDARTMELHYTKHHQTYIDKLNAALDKHAQLKSKNIDVLLSSLDGVPADIRTDVRNNGGGHYNHSLFWHWMKPKSSGKPVGKVAELINKKFKNFDQCKEQFSTSAKSVFGSGWAWLVIDKQGDLDIVTTANQDSPISKGQHPILGLDVWEHAYYLKYQNKRPDYISAWWNVVNWEFVEELYRAL